MFARNIYHRSFFFKKHHTTYNINHISTNHGRTQFYNENCVCSRRIHHHNSENCTDMRSDINLGIKIIHLSISWYLLGINCIDDFTCFILHGASCSKCLHNFKGMMLFVAPKFTIQ
jgi:hypothetical protein